MEATATRFTFSARFLRATVSHLVHSMVNSGQSAMQYILIVVQSALFSICKHYNLNINTNTFFSFTSSRNLYRSFLFPVVITGLQKQYFYNTIVREHILVFD